MPYRREQFNASILPSVRPSVRLFIHSFSNVIIKFYTQSQGARKKQTRLIMENVANGSLAEIHYYTEMFYKK